MHDGEQNADGTYIITQEDMTICEPCLTEKTWGFTQYADDVPGEKCAICDATD